MIPHERSLVKRLQGEPFVLLGINVDSNRHDLDAVVKQEQIQWRVVWDKSFEGPIVRKWNVRGYPTTYVLDHKSVIRRKNVYGRELDEAVDRLLKEITRSPPGK
jgi:hypothetical protein